MDSQYQTIALAVVGGIIIASVVVFVWYSIRATRTVSRRRFIPQRNDLIGNPHRCECPPYERDRCVPARLRTEDQIPVAIYGVSVGDCCGQNGQVSQAQVQSIVDRINRLRAQRQDRELTQLLSELTGPSQQ